MCNNSGGACPTANGELVIADHNLTAKFAEAMQTTWQQQQLAHSAGMYYSDLC